MRQFMTIFKFELASYLKNKIFIGITILMVLLIAGALSFPRIKETFHVNFGESEDEYSEDVLDDDLGLDNNLDEYDSNMLIFVRDETVLGNEEDVEVPVSEIASILGTVLLDNQVVATNDSQDTLTSMVEDGVCEAAIVIHSPTSYTYIVNDVSMYDSTEYIIEEVLLQSYQLQTMMGLGMSAEAATSVMNAVVEGEVITLGKNQMDNFFYTYILIFGLYMAILLYGQFVATSVATEKSSRAMELLITSAKTNNLMFGKVLGAGAAGLLQIVAILGTSFIGYGLNQSYWADNFLIQSIFDMPFFILIYTIIFFILGFLIYSFLYGAVGSLASKVEDINTSVMPITFLFIIAFFIVVTGMTSGNVDSGIMVVASYFPFTSPMAMFTRIAMGNVSFASIMISIVILIVSTIGIGILSAKIYRLGVLMYGKPPKIGTMIKTIIKKENN